MRAGFERRGGGGPPAVELPEDGADPKENPCIEHLGDLATTLAALHEKFGVGQPFDSTNKSPWDSWEPSRPEPGEQPGLYQIGTTKGMGGPHAPLSVPFLDMTHWKLPEDPRSVDVTRGLLTRTMGSLKPGDVEVSVYDPDGLGTKLAPFAPLAEAGLLKNVGPKEVGAMLDELAAHILRIKESVLGGRYDSLREMAEKTGTRPEPWRIAVLMGNNLELSKDQLAQLKRILQNGAACGVHVIMQGIRDIHGKDFERLEEVTHERGKGFKTSITGALPVTLAPGPPDKLVTDLCQDIAKEHTLGPPPPDFASLLPERAWTESSATGITVPVGIGKEGNVGVELGDNPPHMFIGGPSGSGKTNFIYAMLAGLAKRLSPEELQIDMLDFKEGVSAGILGPTKRDQTWLPHLNILGTGINQDTEFGLAYLQYLKDELKRRADAFKEFEVTKLERLREEDPEGHWPRIVAVIDEFQHLFGSDAQLANEIAALLEDIARQGRSAGIHLVLATQDTAGVAALWQHPGLVKQLTERVALPQAPGRVLADDNTAAQSLPKWHAIINKASGAKGQNEVARIPEVTEQMLRDIKHELHQKVEGAKPPRIFDGARTPKLEEHLPSLKPVTGRRPAEVLVGKNIDAEGAPTKFKLSRAPGRNIGVFGSRTNDALGVLESAAISLHAQHEEGSARYSIVCLDDELLDEADQLQAKLGSDAKVYDLDSVKEFVETTAKEVDERQKGVKTDPPKPHYIIGFPMDAGNNLLRAKEVKDGVARSGLDHLTQILREGPEQRTHLIGWWRGMAQFKESVSGIAVNLPSLIGSWVALDVQGQDLAPLSPILGGPKWAPRANRALVFDRSVDRKPHTSIPFGGQTRHDRDGAE